MLLFLLDTVWKTTPQIPAANTTIHNNRLDVSAVFGEEVVVEVVVFVVVVLFEVVVLFVVVEPDGFVDGFLPGSAGFSGLTAGV